jgi:hypothetical protein
MQAVYFYFYPAMASCNDGNGANYIPKTTVSAHCQYMMDVGQDVTLYAIFHDPSGREEIRIPSHMELKGPNNDIILAKEFDEKFVYKFRPTEYGNYTVTITSLEDENNRLHFGTTLINYGLGFFPESSFSSNYFGRFLVYMWFAGYLLMFVGIGLGIYGVIKSKKPTHASL